MGWYMDTDGQPAGHENDGAEVLGFAVGGVLGTAAMGKTMGIGFAIGGAVGVTIAGIGFAVWSAFSFAKTGRRHGYGGVALKAAVGVAGHELLAEVESGPRGGSEG